MATHSSILAWRIQWTEESIGSQRVGHDWSISAHRYTIWNCLASQVALVVKNLPATAGDVRGKVSIPGLGRSPGGGHGHPLQYSCRENPMDRGAWRATVHGVSKSRTWLKRLGTHAHTLSWLPFSLKSKMGFFVPHTFVGKVKKKPNFLDQCDCPFVCSLSMGVQTEVPEPQEMETHSHWRPLAGSTAPPPGHRRSSPLQAIFCQSRCS